MNSSTLSSSAKDFAARVKDAQLQQQAHGFNGPFMHDASIGYGISGAYEQLRNAAEYAQEHLLLQRAIHRFCARTYNFRHQNNLASNIGEELAIELMHAGYVKNDSLPIATVSELADALMNYNNIYWELRGRDVPASTASEWVLQLVSVACEKLIVPDPVTPVFTYFAFTHYQNVLAHDESMVVQESYQASLYAAIHKSLLKSDIANVRYDLLRLYNMVNISSEQNLIAYVSFNNQIDKLFSSQLTELLTRTVNKYGAPLRVLKNMLDDNPKSIDQINDRSKFLAAFEAQANHDYAAANKRVNRGVVKSIAFLVITKALIGVAIEIPYDLWVTGSIIVLPLVINLGFPMVYMALLKFSLKMPGSANTNALRDYIAHAIYDDEKLAVIHKPVNPKQYSVTFQTVYVISALLVFGLVAYGLSKLEFNIVQGGIFFIFFSTASFLGFRLLRMVNELEIVTARATTVSVLRDLIYLPFVFVGQWLSDKYAKLSIATLILDTAIELPLKTLLRLIRQWMSFLDAAKDRI